MASWRKTKKAFDCSRHYVGPLFIVTDDPYPIYNKEDYCTVGKFNFTWDSYDSEYPCEKCKRFKGSIDMNRKQRKLEKEYKRNMKFWNHCERAGKQHGLTGDEYFKKFYYEGDCPFDNLLDYGYDN